MARRRTSYNVDTRTKILDTHTQFRGGLKTVDTDDSVKDFFLRDVENISLSEFGFLERRYGLVNDTNFEFLVDVATEVDLPTGEKYYRDRLQGFFEYTRKDKSVEQIIFYNGRLYLNGVQVRQLYQYPSKFDPILGQYNNNITENQFIEYLARVHNYTDFTSFNDIDNLFQTGRQVEGVRIDDRMFFFTGIYPIVYEGTGEFYLLPEYVTNFEQLALFSHNLHTADLDTTYTAGFETNDITIDATELTQPYFSEVGYAPMFPYMVGNGRGFTVRTKFKMPAIDPYVAYPSFEHFFDGSTPVTGNAGIYLQLVPEVYYRPAGLSGTEEAELWTRVEDNNLEYKVLSNLSTSETVRQDPTTFNTGTNPLTFPSFLDINKAFEAEALYTTQQKAFNFTIQNMPSGLQDIKVDYKIYQCEVDQVDNDYEVVEKVIFTRTELIRNITFTSEKTDDYVNVVIDDEGNETLVPVNDPAALWSCNRVLNHYGKLMAYGSLIHPERIFIGHPTYIHYFPYFFTRDFDNDAQEPLQQITPFMNILVVQSETYTWGLKGIDAVLGAPNFYTPFVISPIYGTIAPKSVRPVRNQLFFLSQDGIVSIQSLYAIDEQYNVKHIDKNIENIIPLDPEAVAIQYDNQYWINFPNTPNNMTLRYHVDLKAWMKDTYFEYNGLDDTGNAVLSNTIFNGVYKYIREDDKLVIITNPMRLGKNAEFVDDNENYRIMRLYVDYSIATDVKEVPRSLFETSFLDQDYPFNEKKYIEEKMQFTIQNEYHLGKEPIFRDESMAMNDIDLGDVVEDYGYTLYRQPLVKNHDYEILVPKLGLPTTVDEFGNVVYPNELTNIKQINVRLFDIQGNLIDDLEFKDNIAPVPSIYNLQIFPATNTITFSAYNNDIVSNTIDYYIDNNVRGSITVPAYESRPVTVTGIQLGSRKLELTAERSLGTASARRVLYFQLPDGVYDEDVFEPIIPSLPPVDLQAFTYHITAVSTDDPPQEIADRIVVTWDDQNNGSEKYRYTLKPLGGNPLESQEVTEPTFTINFTEAEARTLQLTTFQIEVEAWYENQWSIPAIREIKLEYLEILPTNVTDLTSFELPSGTNERIKFSWTDVENESSYLFYYKYVNDNFATLNDYPATQKKILNPGTELYLFDTNGNFPDLVQVPKNAIIEVLLRPINQIGPAPTDAVRQELYRAHYPIDEQANPLVIEPINGQAGFKVTIPEALKQTATSSGYVFEKAWEVQWYDTTQSVSFPETVPAENQLTYQTNHTKNYFEVTGLEPNRDYRVRFVGRYDTNGTDKTPIPFSPAYYITATTGNESPVAAAQPSITDFNYSYGTSAGTATASFILRNNHSTSANLYYQVRTSATPSLSSSSGADGVIPNVPAGTTVTVSGRPVSDNTTYYVHALADNGEATLDSPVTSTTGEQVKDWVYATFSTAGGNPGGYSDQDGYSPKLVVSPGTPTRSGFTFEGWSPSLPREIPVDTLFTAQWSSNTPPPPPQTATPSTTAVSSTSSSVTFGITNNDTSTATITWQIVGPSGGAVATGNQSVSAFNGFQAIATGLSSGTTYSLISVVATAAGKDPSGTATVRSLTTTGSAPQPPAAPSSVSISSPANNQISFNWTASSGATSYTYRVHYSGSIIETNTISGTSATATVPAGSIFVSVAATNANGTSSYTNSATITVSGSGLG